MGKSFKKSLIISLGVLMFGLMPNMVDAASFSWGTKSSEDNITRIPVVLEVGSGEVITTFKINCETNHTDVSCSVNKLDTDQVISFVDDTITYVGDGVQTSFPEGKHTIIELILTNSSSSRLSDVEVSLTNSNIQGVAQSKSINTSVGAKPAEKVKSSVATLSNVKFSQGTISPEFNSDTTEYTVYKIADTINSVRITPTCTEGECDFSLSGGKSISGMTVTLNQGENTVKLEVTSEDGQNSLTYTFKVYRGETTFNSAKLSSLSFGDYTLTPTFSKEVKEYTITVPNTITNVVDIIKYQTEDKNAKVKIEGIDNFVVGSNNLKITIDNVNGDETIIYNVSVTRLSEENIEILSFINDEITFKDADGIQTKLAIDAFKVQYPNEYQRVKNGFYKFDSEGNIINEEEIKNSEDTSDEEKKDNNKIWLIVLLIIMGLVVIIVSGILIFKKRKPKDDNITNENSKEIDEEEEIDETGIEESVIGSDFSKDQDTTIDIDEALSDLMSTKQYEFKEEE